MTHELLVGGVIVSPVVAACAAALLATAIVSEILARSGFYRLVWHRPLVEASIFCITLGVVASVPGSGL